MKQIFDWLREQYMQRKALWEDKSVADRFSAEKNIGTWNKALELLDIAEAKWEADCCIWKGFDNSLTKGKIEWTYKITCQSQPRYIPEDYTDSLWTRCPYCGKPIKISEVE